MRVDACGILFGENDVDPCHCNNVPRKSGGYNVHGEHLPCVSSSSGHGETHPRNTSANGVRYMM